MKKEIKNITVEVNEPRNLRYDGKVYRPGDTFEANADDANHLRHIKRVIIPDAKKAAPKPDKKSSLQKKPVTKEV